MKNKEELYERINKLGIKLRDNKMDYGCFTDDEKMFIASAAGFIFIKYTMSKDEQSASAYTVYDTDREKHMAHTDEGWSTHLDEACIYDDIDGAFKHLLEPYITNYFNDTVIPNIPPEPQTVKSILSGIAKKITELNTSYSDIVIPLMISHSWHNIILVGNTLTTYMNADPNSIYTNYRTTKHQPLGVLNETLAKEILYSLVVHTGHVLIVEPNGEVCQLIDCNEFDIDALDVYLDSINDSPIVREIVDEMNKLSGSRAYDVDALIDEAIRYVI